MQGLRNILIILLICLITGLVSLSFASLITHALKYDISILQAINSNRIEAFDPIFVFITNSSSFIAILIIAATFLVSFLQKSPSLKRQGWQLLSAFIFAFIIIKSLKYSIGRVRPFENYSSLEKLVDISTPSFPSGHTLESAAIATTIVILFKNKIASIVAVFWALAVAYSRMVLGVHYPSDVIAGIALGVLVALINNWLFMKKFGNA